MTDLADIGGRQPGPRWWKTTENSPRALIAIGWLAGSSF